jgi:hypothetical protein
MIIILLLRYQAKLQFEVIKVGIRILGDHLSDLSMELGICLVQVCKVNRIKFFVVVLPWRL